VAVRLGLVLVLCWVPWPGLGAAFAGAFSGVANHTVGSLRFDSGRVALEFEPSRASLWPGQANPTWHVIVAARNTATNATTRSIMNVRAIAYMPLTVLLALVLAFPLMLDRRWVLSTALATVMVTGFVALSVALSLSMILTSRQVQALHVSVAFASWLTALFSLTAETNVAAPAILFGITRVAAGPILHAFDRAAHRLRSLRLPRLPSFARAAARPVAPVAPVAPLRPASASKKGPKRRPKRRGSRARAAAR
jgi:hypothetical protein